MQMKFVASLLTLYEENNISRAAAKLYITQQGLSRQIRALEEELGLVLFRRSKLGVTPTEICKSLIPGFKSLYGQYESLLSVAEEQRNSKQRSLSVAFAQGISNSGSADFIFEYQQAHPELRLEISEWTKAVCIQKLLSGQLDMAFLVNPFDVEMFSSHVLSDGEMYAAMHKNHPLADEKAPLEFALLDGENIITGAPENALREMFDYFCAETGITPHVIVASNYSLNYVNSMHENKGIATLTSSMGARITNPDIRIRRLITPEPGLLYCCTSKNKSDKKEILKLLDFVKEYFKREPVPKLAVE